MEILEALKVHFKDKPSFQRPICNFVAELYSNAHPNKRMKIQTQYAEHVTKFDFAKFFETGSSDMPK